MWEIRDHIKTQASYHPPGSPYITRGLSSSVQPEFLDPKILYQIRTIPFISFIHSFLGPIKTHEGVWVPLTPPHVFAEDLLKTFL